MPYSDRSFLGYRLLQEYFTFPEKFLFFEISGLERVTTASLGPGFENGGARATPGQGPGARLRDSVGGGPVAGDGSARSRGNDTSLLWNDAPKFSGAVLWAGWRPWRSRTGADRSAAFGAWSMRAGEFAPAT